MELTEEQAKRRQAFLDWNVESVLPETVGDYRFHRVDRQEGRIYYAFSYVNEATGWEVKALFDEETMDYMVKTDFRLFVMTDIEILTGNFEDYKKAVETLLVKNMRRELIERDQVSVVVRGRAFTAWDWQGALPETVGHYRRMIEPSRPLLGLNGSYIIAVYECRERARGIVFFYNMFRNEYYAEMSAENIPIIIHQYDADSAEHLDQLIRRHLADDLAALDEAVPVS